MNYEAFHRRSIDDPEAFWGEQAELIDWHRRRTRSSITAIHPSASGSSAAKPTSATTRWTAIWPTAPISPR
jgi:hypothetical protein